MRSPEALVAELRAEAAHFTSVAIAVGFEQQTKFVFAHDPDPLAKLNALVQAGGEPVGLIGHLNVDGGARLYSRALQEHAEDAWVGGYLNGLIESFARVLTSAGYSARKIVPQRN